MFEYVSQFQGPLAEQLRSQIRSGAFSQVSLFGGPRYSLRMSFALETARALSCRQNGRQDCDCESCRRFAMLSNANVLVVSQRDHKSMIETNLNAFCRLRNDFSRLTLIRSIRLLLLSYHPAFSPASAAQNSVFDAAGRANELLIQLAEEKEIGEKEAKKYADELRSTLKALLGPRGRNTTVTIGQVRAIDEWINHTNIGSEKRFIILEAMETTNVNARNSLLKMLEEPPADTYFLLISEFPSRIMSTILSRVRKYTFPPLDGQAVQRYLQPYYLHDRTYESLEQFYLEGGGLDLAKNREIAGILASSVLSKRNLCHADLVEILNQIDAMDSYEYLLKCLLQQLYSQLEAGTLTFKRAKVLSELAADSYSQAQLYNQNGKLMLEALYYRMMEE